jgi:hypothetical protein
VVYVEYHDQIDRMLDAPADASLEKVFDLRYRLVTPSEP